MAFASSPTGTWNQSYAYREQLIITNNSSNALDSGYSVSLTFDHASMVSAGKSLASGADIRIAYWNGSAWAELDRALDVSSSWNSSTTKIWFKTQASIPANGTDNNYFLVYGNASAAVPTYDHASLSTTIHPVKDNLSAAVSSAISADHSTFTDGTDFWRAAPGYIYAFAADSWYAFAGDPDYFTSSQIKNYIDKFVAAKNAKGELPIDLNSNGNADTYYSAWDDLHSHATGDGAFFVPMMEKLYYDKSNNIADFNSNAAALKTALSNIPRDSTTKLVYVDPSDQWIPWGFQDMVRKTGDDLMGSLLYYQASKDMAALYTANGDATNATFFTNEANNIQNNISTLWDATDGMFYAATGQDHQIDIEGSAYAYYVGITTDAQATSISNYLVNNYATLTSGGYIRQSPQDWAYSYYINGGASIYGSGQYDNGRWSVANEWVADALMKTSSSKAVQFITDFANGPDLKREYFGVSAANGMANNLESPMGAYKFYNDNSSLFSSGSTTQTITTSDYNNVFAFWDDFPSIGLFPNLVNGWSGDTRAGAWGENNGTMQQTVDNGINYPDVKITHNVNLSDNFVAQVDFKLDSFDAVDAAVLGLCINSTDAGNPSATGYCSTFHGINTGNAYVLDEETAWGTGAPFSWTSGVWYRTAIARIGSTIYRKTWAVGDPEPANWQETYTESNNLSSTSISLLSSDSVSDFDNVIVRPYVLNEPTIALGSETVNNLVLSSIGSSNLTSTGATVAWTSSNAASTKVSYGLTSSYGSTTAEGDLNPMVTSHSIDISGLSSCTTYHYQVYSKNAEGIEATSNDETFKTAGCVSPAPIQTTTSITASTSTPSTQTTSSSSSSSASPSSSSSSSHHDYQKPTHHPKKLPKSTFQFSRNLSLGNAGKDVAALQKYLRKTNFFRSSITGFFDAATKNALITFQRFYHLVSTGLFGPATQDKIMKRGYTAFNTKPVVAAEQGNQAPSRGEENGNTATTILNSNPSGCSYKVESGDTLWSIARKVYGTGSDYSQIIEHNKTEYPDISSKLSIGQELILGCDNTSTNKNNTGNKPNQNSSNPARQPQTQPQPPKSNFVWWNPLTWFSWF